MEEKLKFLDNLRTFVRVDGMTSFKHAESVTGLSTGTIRNHLNELNEMLDAKVTKGIKKTDPGKRIDVEARRLLGELEGSLDAARSHLERLATPKFPVQVAMSPTIWMWGSETELLPLTHSLPKRNAVEFLVANSERVERAVVDGWFELGLTARHPAKKVHAKLSHRRFCKDEIVLAVPPQHEWHEAEEISVSDLCEIPLITLDTTANARAVIDHALAEAGFELVKPHEEVAMAVMAFDEALEAGIPALVSGLAFRSPQARSALENGIRQCRVTGVDLSREFLLIHGNLRDEATEVMKELRKLNVN